MRTLGSIKAVISDDQPLDRPSRNEVFADNLRHVLDADVAVPDRLGINDYGRPMLALVETSGLVGADRTTQAGASHGVLKSGMKLSLAVGGAGGTGAAGFANISADKNVALEFRQSKTPWCWVLLRFYVSFPPAGMA